MITVQLRASSHFQTQFYRRLPSAAKFDRISICLLRDFTAAVLQQDIIYQCRSSATESAVIAKADLQRQFVCEKFR